MQHPTCIAFHRANKLGDDVVALKAFYAAKSYIHIPRFSFLPIHLEPHYTLVRLLSMKLLILMMTYPLPSTQLIFLS